MSIWGHVYQKALTGLVPIGVHFDLTYRCHQRCCHCYIPREWRQGHGPGPELSTSQIKNILDQLAAAGTFFLSFSGGEVFLRQDLFEVLRYARKLNFAITLFTSGTKGLSPKELDFLADIGIEMLLVSFYSLDAQVHDAITGMPGSWSKVWKIINYCFDIGFRVGINAPLLAQNLPGLHALKDYALEKEIILRIDSDIVPCWDPNCYSLSSEISEINDILDRVREKTCNKTLDNSLLDFKLLGCGAGVITCYISPQGNIRPCVGVSWDCGNLLKDEGFSNIWRKSPGLIHTRVLQKEMGRIQKKLCEIGRKPQDYQH